MKELVIESFEAVKEKIDRNNKNACFEIFGFDFMIDAAFNVWLIEINNNPCLEESSPLLEKLIPRMIGLLAKFPIFFEKTAFFMQFSWYFTPFSRFPYYFPSDDAFKLTLDKIFPSSGYEVKAGQFKVNGYNDCVNMWEYLSSISSAAKKIHQKNGKMWRKTSIFPIN